MKKTPNLVGLEHAPDVRHVPFSEGFVIGGVLKSGMLWYVGIISVTTRGSWLAARATFFEARFARSKHASNTTTVY